MYAVTSTRVLRPVPTLLGGSGRARATTVRRRLLPALLQPSVGTVLPSGGTPC
jgi:hypothetical protein